MWLCACNVARPHGILFISGLIELDMLDSSCFLWKHSQLCSSEEKYCLTSAYGSTTSKAEGTFDFLNFLIWKTYSAFIFCFFGPYADSDL